MNLKHRLLIITALFIVIPKLKAQEKTNKNYFIEPVYQYGFLWQHRPSMADIAGGNIQVFQLTLGQKSYGKTYWDQLYRYPDRGVGYCYVNLGNPDALGNANALYYYLRIPIVKWTKFSINYKISGGLAYINQENIAIGSHINLYFDFSLDTKLRLGKRIELINAFGATHFSNGAIRMPNLGINLFAYRIGINYKLQSPEATPIKQELPELLKKNVISFVAGAGVKQKRPDGDTNFTVASASIDYLRILGHQHKVGAGIDIFYDETMFSIMDPDSSLNLKTKDIMRYGFHLSYEARINRLVLAVHVGTYLHANYTNDGKIYQRIALRYLITYNLFTNISLKTSKGIADFVEWGVGYQFKWK